VYTGASTENCGILLRMSSICEGAEDCSAASMDTESTKYTVDDDIPYLDCTPSDAGLQVIVVELCEHWRELALSLGIPNNDIEACERTQAGGVKGLTYWANGKCSKEVKTTWQYLLDNVSENQGPNVAKRLKKKLSGDWQKYCSDESLDQVWEIAINPIKEALRTAYEDLPLSYTWLQGDQQMNCLQVDIVRPVIAQTGKNKRGFRLMDVLIQSKVKNVLVEGEYGSGKSTLINHLCRDFACYNTPKEYKIVVLGAISNMTKNPCTTLEELLRACAVKGEQVLLQDERLKLTQYIIRKKGKGVLFVVDCWDEMPQKYKKNSIVKKIICREEPSLNQASMVLTSTPAAVQKILKIDTCHVRMRRLEDVAVKQFTRASFSHAGDTKLLHLLKERPLLKSLCYLPLFLAMICFIFKKLQQVPKHTNELLQVIICLLVNEESTSQGNITVQELHRTVPNFDRVCKLALEGIMSNKTTIHDPVINEGGISGLLHCFVSRHSQQKSAQFKNIALQEYLASYGIAQQSSEDQFKFWETKLQLKPNASDIFVLVKSQFRQMFMFYVGITGLKNSKLHDKLLASGGSMIFDPSSPLLELSVVAFHSNNTQFAQELMSHLHDKVELIIDSHTRPYLYPMFWTINTSPPSSLSLGDPDNPLVPHDLGVACEILKNSLHLKRLKVYLKNTRDCEFDEFSETSEEEDTSITLSCYSSNCPKDFCSCILTRCKSTLESITFVLNSAADSFGNTLTDALVECPQLKILTLNNMTVSDYKVFERILQGSPKLTNINFDNVHCKNDSEKTSSHIAWAVQHHCMLKEIRTSSCSKYLEEGFQCAENFAYADPPIHDAMNRTCSNTLLVGFPLWTRSLGLKPNRRKSFNLTGSINKMNFPSASVHTRV
jgi:hypothetical protein